MCVEGAAVVVRGGFCIEIKTARIQTQGCHSKVAMVIENSCQLCDSMTHRGRRLGEVAGSGRTGVGG